MPSTAAETNDAPYWPETENQRVQQLLERNPDAAERVEELTTIWDLDYERRRVIKNKASDGQRAHNEAKRNLDKAEYDAENKHGWLDSNRGELTRLRALVKSTAAAAKRAKDAELALPKQRPIDPKWLREQLAELPIRPVYETVPSKFGGTQKASRLTRIDFPILEPVPDDLKTRKGETPRDAFAREGETLKKLTGERKRARGAQLTFEEGAAAIDQNVDRRAANGAPRPEGVVRYRRTSIHQQAPSQGSIAWPVAVQWTGDRSIELERAIDFVCWLFPDQVKARLREELRAMHDPARALSVTDRAKKIAQLDAEILEQQRVVEAWALKLQRDGEQVIRDWETCIEAALAMRVIAPGDFD